MSRTSSRVPHPASPHDLFTMLCGQQVKVKNTFLDDVVREQSSNESTLAEAQTCPEFRRNDELSSSSASNSGSGSASATQSLCLGTDPEFMVNTLRTLSTPPCSLRYQLPVTCDDFTDIVPHTMPLELLQEVKNHEERASQLLSALQAMPDAPFPLLSPLPAHLPHIHPEVHGVPGAFGADLNAMAAAFSPIPNLPHVPWAPVLSTIPPQSTHVGQMEAKSDPEPQEREAFHQNEIHSQPALGEATDEADQAGLAGLKDKKKKKTVSKVWCHFYLEPTMLRSGFDVNKKIIGHGGANTKRIFEKTGAKIRLRGRGSGHSEGDRGEAPVPLMLAVTSDTRNQDNFFYALEMSAQLLQTVTGKFPDFCRHHGHSAVVPQPLFWIGDASQDALANLEHAGSQVWIGKTEVTLSLDAAAGGVRGTRRGGY